MKIIPRAKTPDLAVDMVGGGHWRLSEKTPEHLTLIVFYRGHHCPLCKRQLQEFDQNQTLYASMIQTMPFSRPSAAQLLKSLDYIVSNGYPARRVAQIGEMARAS